METMLQTEALITESVSDDLPKEESPTQEKQETNKDPPPLDEVEAILGYEFKNKCLLEEAFTHSTYHTDKCFSYERLEYVGDTVLNMLVTKEQYFLYPDLPPGQLTRLRAANVDTEKLARVAIKHGLHRYMRHKKPLLEEQIHEFIIEISQFPLHSNGLIDVPKSLADIVESTIGAVFIDCDCSIDTVWKVFKSLLEPKINPETIKKHPKTELHEACQRKNWNVQFVDLWRESMTFNVLIDNKLVGSGICGAKKEIAQNRAAKNALDNIEQILSTRETTNDSDTSY